MSERLPTMKLNLPNGTFEATPENSTLFTFVGHLASRSHVFLLTGEVNNDVMTGSYIFEASGAFDSMHEFMIQNEYPMHLNLREIAQCDEDAYNQYVDKVVTSAAVDDFVPSDWDS